MLAYAKALVSGAVACLTAVAAGLDDGHLTPREYVTAAIALLVGLGITAAVPNKP